MIDGRNIALIGFMAAGKTSVGKRLAERTGLPFFDIDRIVEEIEGASVADIFARRGEAYFREREGLVFRQICEGANQIIACGGGTVIDERNRECIEHRCHAVWLRASAGAVLQRIAEPGAPIRPLVREVDPGIVVPELMRRREALYAGADLVIETDGRSIEEIALEIQMRLGLPGLGAPCA